MRQGSFRSCLNALLLGSLCVGFASCVSIDSKDASEIALKEDPSRGIYCTYETALGSSVRRKHCTTPEQRDADLSQAQELLNRPALGGSGRRGSGM